MLKKEEILKIAKLANVEINDIDLEMYQSQLSSILEYVEKLNEIDTSGVEPMAHAGDLEDALREDVVQGQTPSTKTKLIDSFTDSEDNLLKVKAVFE